ncbi:MAG: DUF1622 domain-containing protein [Alphaproteobacteria bacterium]|nr:DUF1622 domain-containing protein [Alphaproteobacteria bacterium]
MDTLHQAMSLASDVIGAVGALVITWGVLVGVLMLVRSEVGQALGHDVGEQRRQLRHRVGFYLLVGLEFLLAADIVATIVAPDLQHLSVLGAIVLIRTVISWSLSWELSHDRARGEEAPR